MTTTKPFEIEIDDVFYTGTVEISGTDADCTSEAWGQQVTESWTEYEIESVDVATIDYGDHSLDAGDGLDAVFQLAAEHVADELNANDLMS